MKKKIMLMSAAIFSVAAMFSCTGNVDPEDDNGGSSSGSVYTISADKTELEADASSVVTFTLKDENGTDLTLTDPGSCYFMIEETGEYLDRLQRTYSAFDNGTYTFRGMYKGVQSENTVTVNAVNRSKYEMFHRNVAVYKMTGTWCPNCPSMTAGLNGVIPEVSSHMIILACHGNSTSEQDPYSYYVSPNVDLGNLMLSEFFEMGGFPSLVLNLNTPFVERSHSAIEDAVNEQRRNYPATCGIKVTSTCTGGQLSAEATLMSDKGGTYDIECAILLDNEYYPQGAEPDGKYNHIVRGYSGNFMAYSAEQAKDVAAGEEISRTFNIAAADVPELADNAENCSIVVYALRRLEDGSTMVDNIVSCPVNGTVDYVYNE